MYTKYGCLVAGLAQILFPSCVHLSCVRVVSSCISFSISVSILTLYLPRYLPLSSVLCFCRFLSSACLCLTSVWSVYCIGSLSVLRSYRVGLGLILTLAFAQVLFFRFCHQSRSDSNIVIILVLNLAVSFFCFVLSSGGWGKIKYKLTTFPRILFRVST